MSAAYPIELLSSDEEEEVECICNDNKKAISTFLEFTGISNRLWAERTLQSHGYDVNVALSSWFCDKRNINNKNKKKPPSGDALHKDTVHAQKCIPLFHNQEEQDGKEKRPFNDYNNNYSCDREKPQVVTASSSKPPQQQAPLLKTGITRPILSAEWHRCMERTEGIFVDPDFPPTEGSLDGRKHTSKQQKEEIIIKCLCSLPSTARAVQSNGPNYGRFYFSCGKGRQRRRQEKECRFFQWDDRDGSQGPGYATRYSLMFWQHFGIRTRHIMVHQKQFSTHAVRQGAIGNCWFLSALAVVAEKEFLIQQLMPQRELNAKGCYQVNLFLDGKWVPVIVDSHFPVIHGERIVDPDRGGTKTNDDDGYNDDNVANYRQAFCESPKKQLWAALVEKAYAKVHGSYASLSGGFIQEAFQDLTGAPIERLSFRENIGNKDELWARLLSFRDAGFVMGVDTDRGGDGLIGGHAYSVLDIIEIPNVVVGQQTKMTAFVAAAATPPATKKQKTMVRLVRMRNPWGKREWKGAWSVNSDKWTTALRKRLGDCTFAKGDGTFFMSFDDMLERFRQMEVAKCRQGWKHNSEWGTFATPSRNNTTDPLLSVSHWYKIVPTEKQTWAFLSLVQPKKRANTKSQYWYADASFLLLCRKRCQGGESAHWTTAALTVNGCVRTCTTEILLSPLYEYVCIPFSIGRQTGNQVSFRLVTYSASEVQITSMAPAEHVGAWTALQQLHRNLFQKERPRLQYIVSRKCLLVCAFGDNHCLYFLAMNALDDHYLALRLQVKTPPKGIQVKRLGGGSDNDESFDVPPRTQKLLLVVYSDGTTMSSAAQAISFSFLSDVIKVDRSRVQPRRPQEEISIGSAIELSAMGKQIAGSVEDASLTGMKGNDTIELCQWQTS